MRFAMTPSRPDLPPTPPGALAPLVHRGTGPVATVYASVPPTGGRAAAVKVYPGPLDRQTTDELLEEQRTLAGLRNVSSILLYDGIGTLPDGRAAIHMELCARSLAELVEVGGPLPVKDVMALAETIARVLTDAHAAGIAHGGVTPTNVLLRQAGQPVLADFGLVLRQRFPRRSDVAPGYTAPEVLRGAEPTAATDLYGLGAVMYLVLAGTPPFPTRPGEPPGEVLLRVLRHKPADIARPDLPPTLSELVMALLAKDPDVRPSGPDVLRVLGEPFVVPPTREALDEECGTAAGGGRDRATDPRPELATRPDTPGPPAEESEPARLPVPPSAAIQIDREPAADVVTRSVEPVSPPAGQRPVPQKRVGPRWQLHRGLAAAATLIAATVVILGVLGDDDRADDTSSSATDSPTIAGDGNTSTSAPTQPVSPPTSRPPAAEPVRVEITRLDDNGTTVTLGWRSSKPLTYAVFVAEQGRQSPFVRYRGAGTSLTVHVEPDLKYCFQVQGTDGTTTYESPPRPIRGATCRS